MFTSILSFTHPYVIVNINTAAEPSTMIMLDVVDISIDGFGLFVYLPVYLAMSENQKQLCKLSSGKLIYGSNLRRAFSAAVLWIGKNENLSRIFTQISSGIFLLLIDFNNDWENRLILFDIWLSVHTSSETHS